MQENEERINYNKDYSPYIFLLLCLIPMIFLKTPRCLASWLLVLQSAVLGWNDLGRVVE